MNAWGRTLPYLREMPIRLSVLLILAISACGFQSDPVPDARPALSAVSQDGEAVCDVRKYACDPLDPAAQAQCDIACRFEGSYCLDHTDAEYLWCWLHPDSFMSGYRYCDLWGYPIWTTYCVAGPIA